MQCSVEKYRGLAGRDQKKAEERWKMMLRNFFVECWLLLGNRAGG